MVHAALVTFRVNVQRFLIPQRTAISSAIRVVAENLRKFQAQITTLRHGRAAAAKEVERENDDHEMRDGQRKFFYRHCWLLEYLSACVEKYLVEMLKLLLYLNFYTGTVLPQR